jgi:hypothetical protein
MKKLHTVDTLLIPKNNYCYPLAKNVDPQREKQ